MHCVKLAMNKRKHALHKYISLIDPLDKILEREKHITSN